MKLSERLTQLRTQRGEAVTAMEALLAKSTDEGRSFDETEQAGFDDRKATIKTLDQQIDNCEEMERTLAKSATPTEGKQLFDGAGRIQVVRNLPKGAAFTRYAMSLAAAKGNVMAACEIAKANWSKDTPEVETILRAAVAAGTTTDTTWAAPLAQYAQMASEFVELIRPETFLGRMTGFRNVPFLVRMPRQTAGASAGWVGEGSPKPVGSLAFESITIPHTKTAVIVAITEELARFSSPSAQATVQQDLVNAISQFMDQQMVDPTIAAVSDVSPASLTYGAPTSDSTGATVALVTADLNTAMTYMAVNNIPLRSRYWLLHPRTANYLMTLRTAQDIYAFRDEMSRGLLLGIPFLMSGNMPLLDQTSPSTPASLETYIVLVEASEMFVADDGEVMLDVSREASLQMLTNPSSSASAMVSLWQNNLVGIRAERYIYWATRRAAAVYIIKQVTY
jgi:HK97 family phage major capsid protein